MPINGYFDTVFATAGDKVAVPDPIQGSGTVSYDQGYPIGYSTPVGSGGILITRTSMNQLFYDITSAIQQYQQVGTPPFITSTMNGGTPYSYSMYDRAFYNGVAYQSLVNANTDTPPSSKWASDPLGVTSAIYTAGTTTGSANIQANASVSPAATSFANGVSVVAIAGFTNTASMTYSAGGETAATVYKDSATGPVVLTGGEVVTGNTIIMTKNTGISGWVLTEGIPLGTAAYKSVTDNTKSSVASISGTFTPGHMIVAADTAGTGQDGGPVPSQMLTALAVGSIIMGLSSVSLAAGATTSHSNITPVVATLAGGSSGATNSGDTLAGTWQALQNIVGSSNQVGLFQRTA